MTAKELAELGFRVAVDDLAATRPGRVDANDPVLRAIMEGVASMILAESTDRREKHGG